MALLASATMAHDDETPGADSRWKLPEGLRHEALDGEHLVLLADRNMVLRLDGEAAKVFRAVARGEDPDDPDGAIISALAEHGVVVPA